MVDVEGEDDNGRGRGRSEAVTDQCCLEGAAAIVLAFGSKRWFVEGQSRGAEWMIGQRVFGSRQWGLEVALEATRRR